MLDAGWINETQTLINAGLLESPTAKQAIGYPIITEYIKVNSKLFCTEPMLI